MRSRASEAKPPPTPGSLETSEMKSVPPEPPELELWDEEPPTPGILETRERRSEPPELPERKPREESPLESPRDFSLLSAFLRATSTSSTSDWVKWSVASLGKG